MGVTVEKCLQAWINSLRQMNAKADIVFFGDSLTYYGDFASVFPGKVVCNLGLRGDTIRGMIDRVEQVKMLEPKQVFLMAGINDVGVKDVISFKEDYLILIKSLIKILPKESLVVQSMLPVNDSVFVISCNNHQIEKYNELIYSITENFELNYLNLYSSYVLDGILPAHYTIDGIHLHPKAYEIWFEIINNNYNNNQCHNG